MNVSRLVCGLFCAHTCLQFMAGRLKRELIKTKYVNLTILPLHPPESCGGVWELLTVLEGFKGEPEEDDGVEEAVQTMGPEDLQNRGQKDGGGRKGEGGREIPRRESKAE